MYRESFACLFDPQRIFAHPLRTFRQSFASSVLKNRDFSSKDEIFIPMRGVFWDAFSGFGRLRQNQSRAINRLFTAFVCPEFSNPNQERMLSSNTHDLSGVAFPRRLIESDRHRNRIDRSCNGMQNVGNPADPTTTRTIP